jgi:hypothetical protein
VTAVRTFHATDRAQWRAWLRDNCETSDEMWLLRLPPLDAVRKAVPGEIDLGVVMPV